MTTRTVAGSGVQSWTEDARNFCLRPGQGCLKILDTALDAGIVRRWVELNPGRPVVYRLVQGDDLAGLAGRVDRVLRDCGQLQAIPGVVLYAEIPINEAYQAGDDLSRLNDATVAQIPRYASTGLRPVVGNFSVGMPNLAAAMARATPRLGALGEAMLANPAVKRGRPAPLPPRPIRSLRAVAPAAGEWRRFVPAIRAATAAGGLLGLHEYAVPGAQWWDRWWNGRYLQALDELAALEVATDVGIGEHFVDGGVLDGNLRGWRAFGLTDEQGAALLDTSLSRYAVDPRVRYVALFEGGPYDDWRRRGFEYDTSTPIRAAVERQRETVAPLPSPPEEQPVTTPGIDVSNHQGVIDWPRVAASGVRFAGMKASGDEGIGNVYVDPTFPDNWHQSRANGLVRIAYHYARPSVVSPAASVTTFQRAIQAVGGLAAGDLVALDLEDPGVPDGVSLHVWTAEWLALAENVFGVAPVKYSAKYYTSTHDLEHDDLERFPTWWASYQATIPPSATGWDIDIWQNSASGTVPGVTGRVDTDLFLGTVEELRLLGLQGPVAVVDWETPVFGPIYRGASAVGGMPDKTPEDESDAVLIIQAMDRLKVRHPQ